MKKSFYVTFIVLVIGLSAKAQQPVFNKFSPTSSAAAQPFLFSVNTLTAETPTWNISALNNYAERNTGAFGYDGIDQQVSVKGYLGNRFTLFANADLGFARGGGMTIAQQAEVIRDVVGGKSFYGARFGV